MGGSCKYTALLYNQKVVILHVSHLTLCGFVGPVPATQRLHLHQTWYVQARLGAELPEAAAN